MSHQNYKKFENSHIDRNCYLKIFKRSHELIGILKSNLKVISALNQFRSKRYSTINSLSNSRLGTKGTTEYASSNALEYFMTTIAVMQPYFVPYAGYFRLFAEADVVCIFDCVQFPRRGWVHRNKLPGVAGQAQWLTLPLAKGPMSERIADLRFAENASEALEARFKIFPALRDIHHPLLDTMRQADGDVVSYLLKLLSISCQELGLPFEVLRTTTLKIPNAFTGQGRVLEVCRQLNADRYINLSGGRLLYSAQEFQRKGIKLALFDEWRGSQWSILYRLLTERASQVAAEIKCQI